MSVTCPNKNHPDFIKLSNSVGELEATLIFQNQNVKEGVDLVFQENPELAKIGNREQYSTYLDTIFPNSKVKDIVYHGTNKEFDKFDKSKLGTNLGYLSSDTKRGFYFGTLKEAKGYGVTYEYEKGKQRIIPSVLNITNPKVVTSEQYVKIANDYADNRGIARRVDPRNFDSIHVNPLIDLAIRNNNDGLILEDILDYSKGTQRLVFEPDQIHILGGKSDIEGFKKFTNSKLFSQVSSTGQGQNTNLDNKMKNLIEKMGFGVDFIENSRFANYGSNAVTDMMGKMVYISMNKARIDTLPEEAAHIYVEMLKQQGNPLYNSMMNDIENFDIYRATVKEYSELYNNDPIKLKEEAIGKAISRIIVQKESNETPRHNQRIVSWFDKVLNWFKGLLEKGNIATIEEANNYFEITADKILNQDIEVSQIKKTDQVLRQASSIDNIVSKIKKTSEDIILEKQETKEGLESFYTYLGERFKRVSDIVKGNKKIFDKEDTDKVEDTQRAIWGTNGHEDLMNIFKSLNNEEYDTSIKTDIVTYNTLKSFAISLKSQFPDSVFIPEVKIADTKRKVAGTIDLVVVHPDQTASVFDYKFIEGLANKEIQKWRKDGWSIQLGQYRKILQDNYGIKGFRQTRIIPINATYEGSLENKVLKEIEIGENKLNAEKEYLNPVPVAGELTGDTKIDGLIKSLQIELTKVKGLPDITTQQQVTKNTKIKDIEKAIVKLQIDKDVKHIGDLVARELDRTKSLLRKIGYTRQDNQWIKPEKINYIEPSEVVELYSNVELYSDLVKKGYYDKKSINSIDDDEINIANLSLEFQLIADDVKDILEEHLNTFNIDLNKPIRATDWAFRGLGLSDYDIPAFQSLYKLLTKAWQQKDQTVAEKMKYLEELRKDITEEEFNKILQKKNGKNTGNLVAKNSNEWYKYHKSLSEKQIENSNLFDYKAFDTYVKEQVAELRENIKDFSDTEKAKQVEYLEKRLKNKLGTRNSNSRFYNIPDQYLTEQYKYIRDNPDKAISKLYKYFIEINQFAIENTDVDLKRLTALPYVKKNTFRQIANDGHLKNAGQNLLESMSTYDTEVLEIDENGQPINKVPLRYDPSGRFNPELQDYDLIKIAGMWTESVYNNYHLQQSTDTANLLKLGLRKSKQIIMDKGKPMKEADKITLSTRIVEEIENSPTLVQFTDYLNQELYGINNKTPDKELIGGISRNKLIKGVIQYSSAKTLALNPFTALAQLTGGFAFLNSVAARGNHFTMGQLYKGIGNMADGKVRAAMSLFDVDSNIYDKGKYDNLSVNDVSKNITFDKLFIFLRKADSLLQNAVLVGMMQNYTVRDGKIVIKDKDEKSLLELINNDKDGNIIIEGVEIGGSEFFKFREKVRGVSGEITGNSSEYDRTTAGNTVWANVLLQYRRWILPMATSRFGAFRYNVKMEEYQYGKYKSFSDVFMNKEFLKVATEFITFNSDKKTFEKIIGEKFKEAQLLNSEVQYPEFRKLYIQNLNSFGAEAAIMASVMALIIGLKADDDDDKEQNIAKRIMLRSLTRTSDEISFWYNPSSFLNILKSPIPIIGFVNDVVGMMKNYSLAIVDPIFDFDEDYFAKGNKGLIKSTIGFNTYYQLMKVIDE